MIFQSYSNSSNDVYTQLGIHDCDIKILYLQRVIIGWHDKTTCAPSYGVFVFAVRSDLAACGIFMA